ncbi:hypothetical protein D3C77_668850 [compost metagenome]
MVPAFPVVEIEFGQVGQSDAGFRVADGFEALFVAQKHLRPGSGVGFELEGFGAQYPVAIANDGLVPGA